MKSTYGASHVVASRFRVRIDAPAHTSQPVVLARWLRETGGSFDVIIDDGGHTSRQQWATLVGLWPGLRPGGKLFIEDMGESRTGMYRHKDGPEAERSMIEIVQACTRTRMNAHLWHEDGFMHAHLWHAGATSGSRRVQ